MVSSEDYGFTLGLLEATQTAWNPRGTYLPITLENCAENFCTLMMRNEALYSILSTNTYRTVVGAHYVQAEQKDYVT